jgi:hypothetical protein
MNDDLKGVLSILDYDIKLMVWITEIGERK